MQASQHAFQIISEYFRTTHYLIAFVVFHVGTAVVFSEDIYSDN